MTHKKLDSNDIAPELENNTDVVVSDSNDIVPVYDEVIENAYRKLNEIFVKNEVVQIYNNMLEAGQYLVKLFYDNDYEKGNKEIRKNTNESINKLIKRFKEDAVYGNVPSRSWFYNAVSMARDNNLYENEKLLSTYGKLGHSHKIILSYVKDITKKNKIITKAIDNDGNCCTVELFKKIIKEIDPPKITTSRNNNVIKDISLNEEITEDKLKDITKEKLFSLISDTTQFKSEAEDKINIYTKNITILKNEMKKHPGLKEIFNLE